MKNLCVFNTYGNEFILAGEVEEDVGGGGGGGGEQKSLLQHL